MFVDLDKVLGMTEVAEVLGKTRQYVWNRTQRDDDRADRPGKELKPLFVRPIGRVRATALWSADDLREWISANWYADDIDRFGVTAKAAALQRLDDLLTQRQTARAGRYPRGSDNRG